MVTLRRDIAARLDMGAMGEAMGLTAYDKFLLEKQERREVSEMPSYFSADVADCFDREEREEKPQARQDKNAFSKKQSYEDYMLDELHRTDCSHRIMTRAEYEKEVLGYSDSSSRKARAAKSNEDVAVGKLTKGGKIFVAVYVLLIAVVAFVLIAVNTFAKQSPAMASEDNSEQIEVMSVETEQTSENWFDKLCEVFSAD